MASEMDSNADVRLNRGIEITWGRTQIEVPGR
jgi:hypothetical protein